MRLGTIDFVAGVFSGLAVRNADPTFVFDPVSINTLKANGITFEPVFSGAGNRWNTGHGGGFGRSLRRFAPIEYLSAPRREPVQLDVARFPQTESIS